MRTTLQKWGNSKGLRLPKHLLDELEIHDKDELEIFTDKNSIIIRKAHRRMTFEERMEGYAGDYRCTEWDTGVPKGKEIF